MILPYDFEQDTGVLPKTVIVECPNCQKPARFVPAGLEVRSKNAEEKKTGRDVIVVKAERAKRNYSKWHREHTLTYIDFGEKSVHSSDTLYPIGLYRGVLNSLRGTSICGNCHSPEKIKISWPKDAYYQVSYSGRLLWFYDRSHVAAMLELLSGAGAVSHHWKFWFDRKLPTVFKTARARKQLPAKLKRMLQA